MSNHTLSILGQEIKRGARTVIEMEVAKLHTRNSLKVPIIIERAKLDGPVLLLMGGVHGDETNGVAIIREIIRKKYHIPKRGTIICIPVFNVFGYLNQSREFPDGRDLNRVFPGSERGSLASQFAHKFTKEIAPVVDYIIDFHTGGANRTNFPNIRCVFSDDQTFELAKVFGAPFIVNSKLIPKSIRETMNKIGKTMLLYEGGKSLELDQTVIDCGVNGAFNLMKHLSMQEGEGNAVASPVIVQASRWMRAPYSGIFQSRVKNGSKVRHKEVLGSISDPFGEFEKNITAPFDCHIFGLNTAPIVYKGDAIFHISIDAKADTDES